MFHKLLTHFDRRTGCPVLVNTSFNVRARTHRGISRAGLRLLHAHGNGCPGAGTITFWSRKTNPPGRRPATGETNSASIEGPTPTQELPTTKPTPNSAMGLVLDVNMKWRTSMCRPGLAQVRPCGWRRLPVRRRHRTPQAVVAGRSPWFPCGRIRPGPARRHVAHPAARRLPRVDGAKPVHGMVRVARAAHRPLCAAMVPSPCSAACLDSRSPESARHPGRTATGSTTNPGAPATSPSFSDPPAGSSSCRSPASFQARPPFNPIHPRHDQTRHRPSVLHLPHAQRQMVASAHRSVLMVLGILLVAAKGSVLAPFIYTLF